LPASTGFELVETDSQRIRKGRFHVLVHRPDLATGRESHRAKSTAGSHPAAARSGRLRRLRQSHTRREDRQRSHY
jgi:hypothetical protein